MSALLRLFIAMLLVSSAPLLFARDGDSAQNSKLTNRQVIKLANDFVESHGIGAEGQKLSSVEYFPERKAWLVIYSARSLPTKISPAELEAIDLIKPGGV